VCLTYSVFFSSISVNETHRDRQVYEIGNISYDMATVCIIIMVVYCTLLYYTYCVSAHMAKKNPIS